MCFFDKESSSRCSLCWPPGPVPRTCSCSAASWPPLRQVRASWSTACGQSPACFTHPTDLQCPPAPAPYTISMGWVWPQAENSPIPDLPLGRFRSQMVEKELGRESPEHVGAEHLRQGVTCFLHPASPCWAPSPCQQLGVSCLLTLCSLSLTGTHLPGH